MKILHLLYSGHAGGIEKLCKDIGLYSADENWFCFVNDRGVLYDEMKIMGHNVLYLGFDNKNILKLYYELTKICRDQEIDVVVSHHPAPLLWCAIYLLNKRVEGIKTIVYVHNNFSEITQNKKWKRYLYVKTLKCCGRIIAISESVKLSILDVTGIVSKKIAIVYNGIHCEDYFCSRGSKVNKPIKIVYVGRLIPQKGVQILIEALAKVGSSNQFVLDIVGDGYYKDELFSLTNQYGLDNIVHFHGIQRDVNKYLSEADIFVHPAIWEEGFGITLIEAMSSGLICVAFNKGAIPEIISNGINGFIVNECTPEQLAETLRKLGPALEGDNLGHVREAAIERAKEFAISYTVERLSSIYAKLQPIP